MKSIRFALIITLCSASSSIFALPKDGNGCESKLVKMAVIKTKVSAKLDLRLTMAINMALAAGVDLNTVAASGLGEAKLGTTPEQLQAIFGENAQVSWLVADNESVIFSYRGTLGSVLKAVKSRKILRLEAAREYRPLVGMTVSNGPAPTVGD